MEGFMGKEECEFLHKKTSEMIQNGELNDSDVNQIALDRMREYIERFDKVKEIQRRMSGVIECINKFGSHNRATLLSDCFLTATRSISIDPNVRIGILETLKQFIFEDTKKRFG